MRSRSAPTPRRVARWRSAATACAGSLTGPRGCFEFAQLSQACEREDPRIVQVAEQYADGVVANLKYVLDPYALCHVVHRHMTHVRHLVDAGCAAAIATQYPVRQQALVSVQPEDVHALVLDADRAWGVTVLGHGGSLLATGPGVGRLAIRLALQACLSVSCGLCSS